MRHTGGHRSQKLSSRAVLGGVLLGLGTVFQPKADPEAHWSTSPKIALVVDHEADQAGQSGLLLDGVVPLIGSPAPTVPRSWRRWWRGTSRAARARRTRRI